LGKPLPANPSFATPPNYAARTTAEVLHPDMFPITPAWPPCRPYAGLHRHRKSSPATPRPSVKTSYIRWAAERLRLPTSKTHQNGQHPRQNGPGKHPPLQKHRLITSLGFSYDGPARWDTTTRNTSNGPNGFVLKLYKLLFNPQTRSREPIDSLAYPAELHIPESAGVRCESAANLEQSAALTALPTA